MGMTQSYAAYVKNKANQGFLKFNEWAKLQTCHHCENKGHVCPNCHIFLKKQMVLFPLWAKSISLGLPLPSTSIVVRNCRWTPNSSLISLYSQPSPPNILLTHSLRPLRLQPMVMTTTILQALPKMRMKSTLLGNGGSFKRIGGGLLGSHNCLILKMIRDFMLAFFAHILVNMGLHG
jgi:hypothetical protein